MLTTKIALTDEQEAASVGVVEWMKFLKHDANFEQARWRYTAATRASEALTYYV